jgi:hypothetical protein
MLLSAKVLLSDRATKERFWLPLDFEIEPDVATSPFALFRLEVRGVKSQATAKEIATRLNSKATLVALFMGAFLGSDLLNGYNHIDEARVASGSGGVWGEWLTRSA